MKHETPKLTLYFDGACPLCRAEIDHYRLADSDGELSFVDVSHVETAIGKDFSQKQAIERFHVRDEYGQLFSGAAAFAKVWGKLPKWRWAARATEIPGVLPALEIAYRLFLRVRPYASSLFARLQLR